MMEIYGSVVNIHTLYKIYAYISPETYKFHNIDIPFVVFLSGLPPETWHTILLLLAIYIH